MIESIKRTADDISSSLSDVNAVAVLIGSAVNRPNPLDLDIWLSGPDATHARSILRRWSDQTEIPIDVVVDSDLCDHLRAAFYALASRGEPITGHLPPEPSRLANIDLAGRMIRAHLRDLAHHMALTTHALATREIACEDQIILTFRTVLRSRAEAPSAWRSANRASGHDLLRVLRVAVESSGHMSDNPWEPAATRYLVEAATASRAATDDGFTRQAWIGWEPGVPR